MRYLHDANMDHCILKGNKANGGRPIERRCLEEGKNGIP